MDTYSDLDLAPSHNESLRLQGHTYDQDSQHHQTKIAKKRFMSNELLRIHTTLLRYKKRFMSNCYSNLIFRVVIYNITTIQ